jgi:ABC-type dipeptide/oligopeptide/nickel transport system permease component
LAAVEAHELETAGPAGPAIGRRRRFASYVARRLGWAVLLLWIVTVITFALSRIIPGDPATFLAGFGASNEQIAALRRELHLDDPLLTQYWDYLRGLLHGDLGHSARTGRDVSTDLRTFLPATLELVFVSFFLYLALAIPLGAWTAARRGRTSDSFVRLLSMISSGVPVFWLAMLLQELFFSKLGWLPLTGRIAITESAPPDRTGFYTIDSLLAGDWSLFASACEHLVLPTVAIVLTMLAVGLRVTRASVLQQLGSPYVRTARGKGLAEGRILRRHVMRNSLNPVISMAGLQFGYLLSWIVLVETVFQWPGIGLYAFTSFEALDYAPIMALTLVISFFFIVANLITDLLYPVFDPRLRERGGR